MATLLVAAFGSIRRAGLALDHWRWLACGYRSGCCLGRCLALAGLALLAQLLLALGIELGGCIACLLLGSRLACRTGAVDGLVEIVTQGWRLRHQAAVLAQCLRGAIQIALLQRFAALLHISLGQLALVLVQTGIAAGALLQCAELAARVVEAFFGQAQVELTEGDDQIVDRREAVLLAALATGQK